jgi:protein-S-isoprenylcysteine O-methyltransferase Ste14
MVLYVSTLIAYAVFILTEVVLNRAFGSKKTDKQAVDKHSITLIWITIPTAIFLAISLASYVRLPIYSDPSGQYVGVGIIALGVVIRLLAIYTLGQFFTVDVTIRPNHRIKKDGLYKYLRHPSYAASLLSFIGMGITFNNWLSLLLLVTAVLVVFINRIRVEETVLIEHFGAEYVAYKKVTNGLIPFIY